MVNVPRRKWPWVIGSAVLALGIMSVVHHGGHGVISKTPVAASQAHPSAIAKPALVARHPAPPAGPLTSFGDGIYQVGVAAGNVEPGHYRSAGPTEGMPCYWARTLDPRGKPDAVIAEDYPSGPAIVMIESSDTAFVTSGCGQWSKVG